MMEDTSENTLAGSTGGSAVAPDDAARIPSERLWLLATGLLLVTMPAFTLVVAYAVLLATRSVLVGEITTVQFVELYLVELFAFAVFGYVLYRLTGFTSRRHERAERRRTGAGEGDGSSPTSDTE